MEIFETSAGAHLPVVAPGAVHADVRRDPLVIRCRKLDGKARHVGQEVHNQIVRLRQQQQVGQGGQHDLVAAVVRAVPQ
eukprot:scaffold158484_cov24-Prasinocladus_malaysianus.AAC.1